MDEQHLSDAERKLFQSLEREKSPPQHLEKNITSQLKKEGLIKNTKDMSTYMKYAASVVFATLFFLGGMYYERSTKTEITMVEIEPTKGYMLLLHEDATFAPGDPMAMYEEYKTWMENTFGRGVKITGQELKNEAVVLKGEDEKTVGDEAETRTTGYFLLEANSYEEAVAVAKENPHVKYGGTVEVKPFMVR